MSHIPGIRTLFRLERGQADVAREVDDELRFHFEATVEELIARGMGEDAARAEATRRFGSVDSTRQRLIDIDRGIAEGERRRDLADVVRQDVGSAWRALRRRPGLTATIVVTLALGLGANAAVFTLVDRIFLREPGGVAAPRELRRIYERERTPAGRALAIPVYSWPGYTALRDALAPMATVVTYSQAGSVPLGHRDADPKATLGVVGPGFFAAMGVRPQLGRLFAPDEERVDVPAWLAVVSDAFWRARLGADPAAIGRVIELAGHRTTIVGVLPRDFSGLETDAVDVWVPVGATEFNGGPAGVPWWRTENTMMFHAVARPRPGVSDVQLATRATAAIRAHEATRPERDSLAVALLGPIQIARGPLDDPSWYNMREIAIATRLAGVALLVLLIACANVANLLLARAVQRRREIAIRLALGIARRRLVRQLLVESVLLAALAGGAAVLVGAWGGSALRSLLFPDVHWAGGTLDPRLVAATAALAVAGGLLAGLAPALRASRPDLLEALGSGGREGGRTRSRLRTTLVVAQTALSVMLLVGAGLFARSLWRVAHLDIGFDAERTILAELPREARVDAEALAARLTTQPAVERVAWSHLPPFRGFSFQVLALPGRDSLPELRAEYPNVFAISPGFFAASGMRLRAGRDVTSSDRRGAPNVVVVNAAMAQLLWPGRSPLGETILVGRQKTRLPFTVVGVVENARRSDLIEAPIPQYYIPFDQYRAFDPTLRPAFVVRAREGMTVAAARAVRAELRAAFPHDDSRIWVMAELLAPQLRPWRMGAALFGVLGALALLVTAIGVYSSLAYAVSQRAHEMGVRFALGARPADVVRLVVGEGVRATLVGLAVGAAGALLAGRVVASLLYETSPRDPLVLSSVAALLLAIAATACLVPAWRAARVDPVRVLRTD